MGLVKRFAVLTCTTFFFESVAATHPGPATIIPPAKNFVRDPGDRMGICRGIDWWAAA